MPVETQEGLYFQTISTYIHLNPARARLIRIGEQKLLEYPCSSYPQYVSGVGPQWLVRERVLGSLGLQRQEARGYEAYIESRVLELGIKAGRKELEAGWEGLRRGWYVGGEEFRQRLLARAKAVLAGKRRESHGGGARRAHDQEQAKRMAGWGLRRLGMDRQKLPAALKGQLEKQVLAWWLHGQTTATRRWIAEELQMGYESRVSQAVSAVEASRARQVVEMKQKLQDYDA